MTQMVINICIGRCSCAICQGRGPCDIQTIPISIPTPFSVGPYNRVISEGGKWIEVR